MFLRQPVPRIAIAALFGMLSGVAGPGILEAAGGGGPGEVSAAADAIPVRVESTRERGVHGGPTPRLDLQCPPGTAIAECFEPANPNTGLYLNVGSFFDRREHTSTEHFLLKLLDPKATTRLQVTGVDFVARADRPALNRVGVGVIPTRGDFPILPRPEQLVEIQLPNVVAAPAPNETCVDLAAYDVVLEPGEAAWLVVRFFTATADSAIVTLLADDDPEDHDCDFFTNNLGRVYYRPDPVYGPQIDFALTAFTSSVPPAEPSPPAPEPPTWSLVKMRYR